MSTAELQISTRPNNQAARLYYQMQDAGEHELQSAIGEREEEREGKSEGTQDTQSLLALSFQNVPPGAYCKLLDARAMCMTFLALNSGGGYRISNSAWICADEYRVDCLCLNKLTG